MARDLRLPLLLTGAAGTGKTSAAYWYARREGVRLENLIHEPIRSTSTSEGLKYRFDSIGFFRESQLSASGVRPAPRRRDFLRPGPLWRAYEASFAGMAVLLIDEIDKAPRDLPNDLLFELEEGRFEVPELAFDSGDESREQWWVRCSREQSIVCVFTSNGERELPSAFLRRCLHHELTIDEKQLRQILEKRRLPCLGEPLDETRRVRAVERFFELRNERLQHEPNLAEYLTFLDAHKNAEEIDDSFRKLSLADSKYGIALYKTPEDRRLASLTR